MSLFCLLSWSSIVGEQKKQLTPMISYVIINVLLILQRIYMYVFLFHKSLKDSEWYVLPKADCDNQTVKLPQTE
jgi:hypothetical protein